MQVEAAEEKGKQMVLINARLKDMPSHSGVMGVRGREGRLALADSFKAAYHFRLLYFAGSFYPIMGAMRYEYGGKWQVRPCCIPPPVPLGFSGFFYAIVGFATPWRRGVVSTFAW